MGLPPSWFYTDRGLVRAQRKEKTVRYPVGAVARAGRQGADPWQMVSLVFCLSNSPFTLFFSLLWNFSDCFTEGTVLAYKNRTTGGLYRVRSRHLYFAAYNFRVANKSSSHALWIAQHIQRTKRSVRPQLFKWWILLSTVDNAELVFISSIYWIAIYPADRAITAFKRPEPGHASSVLLQEVKNNENVKTVALM